MKAYLADYTQFAVIAGMIYMFGSYYLVRLEMEKNILRNYTVLLIESFSYLNSILNMLLLT